MQVFFSNCTKSLKTILDIKVILNHWIVCRIRSSLSNFTPTLNLQILHNIGISSTITQQPTHKYSTWRWTRSSRTTI